MQQPLGHFGAGLEISRGALVAPNIGSYSFFWLRNLAVAFVDLALMNWDVDRFIANGGGGIVGLVWILVTIVPALALLVRRLHDTGKSGWLALVGLLPFIGAILLLVFTVTDSTPGDNKYGSNPKSDLAT